MTRIKHILLLLLLINQSLPGLAQDIHFSQFYASPLTLNPALTGLFTEEYRLTAIYRNQWSSVSNPFRTMSASADMNTLPGFFPGDRIGTGLMLYSDKQGTTEFNTTLISFSLSYLKSLGSKNTISLGGQASFGQKGFNLSEATFDRQNNGTIIDPNSPSGERFPLTNIVYPDVSAGFLWSYMPKEDLNIYVGSSMAHLNAPDQSFMGNDETLYTKTTVHAGTNIPLGKNMGLIANAIYLNQGPASELNLGTMLKFKMQKRSRDKTAFYVGSWYRHKDAIIAVTRMDYKNMAFGLSYDVNVSQLRPGSSGRGATEFSMVYFGEIKSIKKKKGARVRSTLYCPKF